MPNICLVRVDNRLIHGQVATSWIQHTKANLVLVANNEVAENTMRQDLMNTIVPSHVETRFFSLQKTADIIHKASDSQKILMIVDNPIDVLFLKKNGVPIDHLNVGNMHGGDGKKPIAKAAYVSEEEIRALKELVSLGVKIEFQQLPVDTLEPLNDIIQNV